MGRTDHYLDQGMHALFAHLGSDSGAAGHYHEPLFRHIRKPDRTANWRHGGLQLYGVYCTRIDYDVGDHQLIRQRFFVVF